MIKSLFKRVTGEKTLSQTAFLAFVPVGILGVAIIIPVEKVTASQRFDWFLVGVIAQAVLAIAILVFNKIYFRFGTLSRLDLETMYNHYDRISLIINDQISNFHNIRR